MHIASKNRYVFPFNIHTYVYSYIFSLRLKILFRQHLSSKKILRAFTKPSWKIILNTNEKTIAVSHMHNSLPLQTSIDMILKTYVIENSFFRCSFLDTIAAKM